MSIYLDAVKNEYNSSYIRVAAFYEIYNSLFDFLPSCIITEIIGYTGLERIIKDINIFVIYTLLHYCNNNLKTVKKNISELVEVHDKFYNNGELTIEEQIIITNTSINRVCASTLKLVNKEEKTQLTLSFVGMNWFSFTINNKHTTPDLIKILDANIPIYRDIAPIPFIQKIFTDMNLGELLDFILTLKFKA
jgi:hypothetical protein